VQKIRVSAAARTATSLAYPEDTSRGLRAYVRLINLISALISAPISTSSNCSNELHVPSVPSSIGDWPVDQRRLEAAKLTTSRKNTASLHRLISAMRFVARFARNAPVKLESPIRACTSDVEGVHQDGTCMENSNNR